MLKFQKEIIANIEGCIKPVVVEAVKIDSILLSQLDSQASSTA